MLNRTKKTLQIKTLVDTMISDSLANNRKGLDQINRLRINHSLSQWGDILDRFFWHPLAHSLVDGGRVPIAVIVFDFLLHQPSEDRGLAEISYQRFYLDLYESKLIDKSGAYIVLTDLGKFAVISRNNNSWYREVIEILRDNKTIAWTVGIIGLIAALVTLIVEGPDVFRRFFGGH